MSSGSAKKRVMIIGQPGSGKSTLARKLGECLKLPVVHIDRIHWQSGWVEREGSEKDRLCCEVHSGDKWIFEGGRSNTWPERLDRADTLIFLDFPLTVRAWRVLKRRVEYHGITRPDLPEGCPENINWDFVLFIWRTRKVGRFRMIRFFESAPGDKDLYWLRNQSEVDRFMEETNKNMDR